jgi:hypothetical protein
MAINTETYRYDRLKPFHVRALLAYLGLPTTIVASIKTKTAAVARLKEEAAKSPDRFEQGIDAIVNGKVSGNIPTDIAKDIETRVMLLLRDFNADEAKGVAEQKVLEMISGLRTDLETAARKAVNAAAENYRPIVIKDNVSGKVLRKIKGILPPEFERMRQLAEQRIPILLVGPAGCGKTYLAEKLGEVLGLPTSDQSCSEGMSESVFNGKLLPTGKGGAYEHHPSQFMIRYEKGGVMLLDEMDAGDSNLFTYMNKAVANDSYTVDQRYLNPVVKKHKDFVIIGAANTFGNGADEMYVGRNQLDAATIDRFKVGMIQMDYSREVEQSLATPELCDWAWKIRDGIRSNRLRRIMSTRVIKDLAKMTEAYHWTAKEWSATYFTGWTQAERNLVGG